MKLSFNWVGGAPTRRPSCWATKRSTAAISSALSSSNSTPLGAACPSLLEHFLINLVYFTHEPIFNITYKMICMQSRATHNIKTAWNIILNLVNLKLLKCWLKFFLLSAVDWRSEYWYLYTPNWTKIFSLKIEQRMYSFTLELLYFSYRSLYTKHSYSKFQRFCGGFQRKCIFSCDYWFQQQQLDLCRLLALIVQKFFSRNIQVEHFDTVGCRSNEKWTFGRSRIRADKSRLQRTCRREAAESTSIRIYV